VGRQTRARPDTISDRRSIGPLPDAMKPGIHCVTTPSIRGFMAFRLARRTQAVGLMMPVLPESGFWGKVPPGCSHLLSGIWARVA